MHALMVAKRGCRTSLSVLGAQGTMLPEQAARFIVHLVGVVAVAVAQGVVGTPQHGGGQHRGQRETAGSYVVPGG